MNILNDLIWAIPFGIILYKVYMENYVLDEEIIELNKDSIEENLSFYETNKGNNIYSDSYEQPILLVFCAILAVLFVEKLYLTFQKNKTIF
ncbi:MAG: hypothetical protein IPN09_08550 [Bacteroidetes bacterium]|nr:hypothetical protein [Bacteroidota bacterium]